ncbi:acyl-CoA thioesterase [Limibacter armeniacum]|uniref:acyl-CoA thioesterase n=1 Tax=Limibacter armeniacum TaxID=466084 RepID=UPI002FE5185A
MRTKKYPKDSLAESSEIVLPNDTNTYGNLMGGRLMYMMDVVGAIAAQRHCNRAVVTASVDNVSFKNSPALGDVITLEAKVTRAFNSSMEIYIKVVSEKPSKGTVTETNTAFFTFVAIDMAGNPITVPELIPETDQEKELYEGALRRRQLRLILAGRMSPDDATELKALFDKKLRKA